MLLAARLADPASRVLVADDGANLVGLCLASVAERPNLFAETRCGLVEHLVVRPEARRSGVGRALAEAAFAWLREQGVGRVQLEVARGNGEGRAFWDALGLEPLMDVLAREL